MPLLNQPLTSWEHQRALDQATQTGNYYHLQKSSVKPALLERENKDPGIPIRAQVVPKTDPRWEPLK
jgi:hypothetical protein